MYFFQSYPDHELRFTGLNVRAAHASELAPGTAQGELSLFVNQHARRELMFEYNTALFDQETIARLGGHLLTLLSGIANAPETPISQLPLITAAEHLELARWNDTRHALPADPTLGAMLHAQVARSPDAIALTFGTRSLTYRELDQRGNMLAHALRAKGVDRGALVGLYVDRTIEMLIGLIGILKAGGAYVPLDPAYPADRLGYMLTTSAARVLVTQHALRANLPPGAEHVIVVDANAPFDANAAHPPSGSPAPDDLAYVIFTSGSTGKPKGVAIRQRAAVNLLQSVAREPGLRASDVLLAISTLSFDIALFELILPLTVGARIVLVDRDTARDGTPLRRMLDDPTITIMQATPATWRMLLEVGWHGRAGLRVVSTGEALPRELADRQLPCVDELWNLYGPTETTVYSALCRVTAGEGNILVGKPVDNTQIHIVDRHMRLLPAGVPGELLIGGDGLAAGYVGRPDLTAEKFIPDAHGTTPGSRVYRSGDLARWRRDGTIEVLGRIDHQIKLRGFRIELGEIETVLGDHPAVTQAVVHCREDVPGDKRLVAYVTTTQSKPTGNTLRDHLKAALPDYMVPSAYVLLDAFPLTPNGKVDRRALPPPMLDGAAGDDIVLPRTPEETELVKTWAELLNVARVDVRANFFDLGGHSLLATQLLARIEQAFGVELPLRTLFEAPTLEQLAARVAAAQAALVPDDLEALLQSLEHLSDEEANARLGGARPHPLGAERG
jgi:amino acid adenylation domain-containing protein